MTVLYYPDARLRRRATMLPGSAFATPGLERYAAGMMADLAGVELCDVLAGPQVDFDPPWRVLAVRTPAGITTLCNPEMKDEADEVVEFETSASFLSIPVQLPAPRKLTVSYRTVDGSRREVVCDPGGARAVWQGMAALEGRLPVDRMTPMGALAFVSKYRRKLGKTLTVPS